MTRTNELKGKLELTENYVYTTKMNYRRDFVKDQKREMKNVGKYTEVQTQKRRLEAFERDMLAVYEDSTYNMKKNGVACFWKSTEDHPNFFSEITLGIAIMIYELRSIDSEQIQINCL